MLLSREPSAHRQMWTRSCDASASASQRVHDSGSTPMRPTRCDPSSTVQYAHADPHSPFEFLEFPIRVVMTEDHRPVCRQTLNAIHVGVWPRLAREQALRNAVRRRKRELPIRVTPSEREYRDRRVRVAAKEELE